MLKLTPVLTLVAGLLVPAHADDLPLQYPRECVAIDQCAPVETISANGRVATIAAPFPVLQSADGRMHVCMRYDPFGELVVTCLLVPSRQNAMATTR